jgi:hypothetical protein
MSGIRCMSDKQVGRVCELYRDGLSVSAIAERMDSNSMSVWRVLKRQGIEIRFNTRQLTKGHNMVSAEKLRELYWTDKLSTVEIGYRYGVGKETVRVWMRRHNIPTRSKSDAAVLGPSEWTPGRIKRLKELWYTKMTCEQIKADLGISYGPRAVSAKAAALCLKPRQEPRTHKVFRKSASEISRLAVATRMAKQYQDRSIISFLPDSPQLESDWRSILSKVREERAKANEPRP